MAKFLKIICNTLIVLAVAIAVALLLPPIMGVTTTIIDSQGIRSNLPVGSVTYSRKVTPDNLKEGDLVLVESKNEAYEYTVVSVDVVTKKMTVKNAFDKSAKEKEMKITNGVSRVSFTIPLIGYAVVAMQTTEGMIVIGLIVLFIIILYILSEVWKKKPEDEDDVPVRKEKTKTASPSPANASSGTSRASSGSSAANAGAGAGAFTLSGAALASAAAAASAESGAAKKEAQEAVKPAEAKAEPASDELTEEEFQRILAEALAKNGPDMEIGLDGWQPAETKTEAAKESEAENTTAEEEKTETEGSAFAGEAFGAAAAEGLAAVNEAAGSEEEAKKEGEETFAEKEEKAGEKEGEQGKKKTVPPRRRSLDEMLEYAKKGGGDPEFRKDDVSGLDVVDYSSFL